MTTTASSDFLVSGYLNSVQYKWARHCVAELIRTIRPDAVTLVDSFGFSDYQLNSALGRYDGNVYETLIEWASREPLNRGGDVVDGYEEEILPLVCKGRGSAADFEKSAKL